MQAFHAQNNSNVACMKRMKILFSILGFALFFSGNLSPHDTTPKSNLMQIYFDASLCEFSFSGRTIFHVPAEIF